MSLAPFAGIEARIAGVTAARLANVQVVRSGGEPFGAELNRADEIAFESVALGAERLVYLSIHGLADGEAISINGAGYRVAGVPRRKDAHFSECEVVRT